jgi:uroporphyrinogen III methyltransferase / synthase
MNKGKVFLVGAGPGDIGLLTIKGLRCLQRAEVIVYDYHLNAQVLNYAHQNAEFIYAGKRGGHHAMTQDEINATLVSKAMEGKVICRLKGGDPFVFGRGGEEAEVLAHKGIEFEIVPGVSSVIAAPACAGIPLTHRDYSSSFSVITGNEATTKSESAIDWSCLAKSHDTLVFLMGVKNISTIAGHLIKSGKDIHTPVAVIRWGARPDQETVTGTLSTIRELIEKQQIRPPAVLVVGNVVSLRDTLKWYENKLLFGHRILITRNYSSEYAPLEDLGAEIFEFPTIRIEPPADFVEIDQTIAQIDKYNWLVFTSTNGFTMFLNRLVDTGRDIRDLKGIKICAIGEKTADVITHSGIRVDLMPTEYHGEGLAAAFSKLSKGDLKGIHILMPRAETAREVFPDQVRALGGYIDTPCVYRTVKPEKHGKRLKRFLFEGRITIATFTSGATFTNFVDMVGTDALPFLKNLTIAAIGPITKNTIESTGLHVEIIPERATIESLVSEIIDWQKARKS